MSSVKDRLSAIGERLAKLAQEFELDEAWSIRAELIGIAHSRDVATLREQPEARGVVDGWRLVIRYGEYDDGPGVWAEKGDSLVWIAALAVQHQEPTTPGDDAAGGGHD